MPQTLAVIEELTVQENIDLPADLMPKASGWPSDDLMERLEIAHLADRLPAQISGGERQRTVLARALRLRPSVLLADEPTGHQDAERIKLVTGLLRTHARYGNVVIATSHDEQVMAIADDLYEIAAGSLRLTTSVTA